MLTTFLLVAGILLTVFTITVLHLPRFLQRFICWTPAWLQAALIHFAYGGWVGGVTGHVVGGLMAVPWFFICRYWLQPKLKRHLTGASRPSLASSVNPHLNPIQKRATA